MIFVAMLLAGSVHAGDIGGYKGYVAIQDTFKYRALKPGTQFQMARYLDDDKNSSFVPLTLQRGLAPNPLTATSWFILFEGLAKDLAYVCSTEAGPAPVELISELRAEVLVMLLSLCSWPNVTDQQLLDLWLTIVGYDAPSSEFESWLARFKQEDYRGGSPLAALQDMIQVALLNPYFLLER